MMAEARFLGLQGLSAILHASRNAIARYLAVWSSKHVLFSGRSQLDMEKYGSW
jgi:hypothetical protein